MKHKILDRDSVLKVLDGCKETIESTYVEDEEFLSKIYGQIGCNTIDIIKTGLEKLTYLEVDLPTEGTNFGK